MAHNRVLPVIGAAPPQKPPSRLYAEAACAGLPPTIFDGLSIVDIGAAKEICSGCPVRLACLDWAMDNEAFGIWGALTPAERDRLRGYPLRVTIDDRAEAELLRRRIQAGANVVEIAMEYGVGRRSVERWRSRAASWEPEADRRRGADHG